MDILIVLILAAIIVLLVIYKSRREKPPDAQSKGVDPTSGRPKVELHSGEPPKTKLPIGRRIDVESAPPIPNEIPSPFDYNAGWWKARSTWYRQQKGWQCEECEISLVSDTTLLHVHHIFGTGYNNPKYQELWNLKVLCIGCHAEQPNHDHMKEDPKYKLFLNRYEEEWRQRRRFSLRMRRDWL